MIPNERHAQDARIQSAALRHYASKCRAAARDGGNAAANPQDLAAWADRADKLADSYERLEIAHHRA